MLAEATYLPTRAKTPIERLRSYLECTLYVRPEPNAVVPPDQYKIPLVLELTTPGAGWDDADIYDSRMPSADVREALRHKDGSDYMPTVLGYADPVTRRILPALGIGPSDGDITANAANSAAINRTVLSHTPMTVTRSESISATMVRRLVEVELARLNPALSQACIDIGQRLSTSAMAKRRCCEERNVRRVNREALDALLTFCLQYLSDRDNSRNTQRR